MSVHASMHVHSSNGETLDIASDVQHLPNRPAMKSAYIKLKVGVDTVILYFDDVEQIENLAFHASTLAQAARAEWTATIGEQRTEKETDA